MSQRTPSPPIVPADDPQTPSAQSSETILKILQRPNPPVIDTWDGSSWDDKTSGNFDKVKLDDQHPSVQPWTDFTFDAIHLAYGHILNQSIRAFHANYRAPFTPSPRQRVGVIDEELHVDLLGHHWMEPIVRDPIRGAAAILRGNTETEAGLFLKRLRWRALKSEGGGEIKPNWGIQDSAVQIQYREPEADPQNRFGVDLAYAVGETKLAQKWKSEWLTLKHGSKVEMDQPVGSKKCNVYAVNRRRLQPLEEVATYCRYGQTRYGFIFTQQELVALRVRRIHVPAGSAVDKFYAAIEYAPVTLTASTGLTANLAVWALACMGMNDAHREMETLNNLPLDAMARLTWWTYDATRKVYQNVISKRQIPAAQWKPEYNTFVKLTEKDGNSFTSDFLACSHLIPPLPTRGISGVTKEMQSMNLGKSVAGAAAATGAKPNTSSVSAPPKAGNKRPSAPQPIPAAAPPKLPAGTTPATGPKPGSGSKPVPKPPVAAAATAPAPAPAPAAPAAPAASRSSPRNTTKLAHIEGISGQVTATYSKTTGKWHVTLGGQTLPVTKTGRDNTVTYRGRERRVEYI